MIDWVVLTIQFIGIMFTISFCAFQILNRIDELEERLEKKKDE